MDILLSFCANYPAFSHQLDHPPTRAVINLTQLNANEFVRVIIVDSVYVKNVVKICLSAATRIILNESI